MPPRALLNKFCFSQPKGITVLFIDKGWALRVAFRQYALLRAGDIFRRGRGHPEPICTCSKLLTIRQLVCPKAMLSPWWIAGPAYIYQCLKHALLRAGDIFAVVGVILNLFALCSKLLTIRQLALPKSDALPDDIPITAEAVIEAELSRLWAR